MKMYNMTMRDNRIKIYKINILILFNRKYNKGNNTIILEYKIIDLFTYLFSNHLTVYLFK